MAVAMTLLTVELSSFYKREARRAELIPGARVIRIGRLMRPVLDPSLAE
jgi:hypothetical protein